MPLCQSCGSELPLKLLAVPLTVALKNNNPGQIRNSYQLVHEIAVCPVSYTHLTLPTKA